MNTYKTFWQSKELEVLSDTTYHAQQLAVPLFQATAGRKRVKGSDVSVYLVALNGEQVTHVADF